MNASFACSVGRAAAAIPAAALALNLASLANVSAQSAEVPGILHRVGERLVQYYKRAQSVICLEKQTVQPIGHDLSPRGFGRVTEYELRLEPDADEPEQVKVVRQLLRVNGRPPRERDAKNRSACQDANPLSTEPLEFLLPAHRDEYRFTLVGPGKGKDGNTLILEFVSTAPSRASELAEDPRGREDCYTWSPELTMRGRVWVDAITYEVRRVEQHLARMAELKVPIALQRRRNFDPWVTVQRQDTTIQYRTVAFTDPEEAMLLPDSIDTLLAVRGPFESVRTRQVFSDYKRFLTGARIIK